ncbi:MAG: ferritin [Bacteroidales bacterium]|nr:ferritin [Bacteroidales bacterium]
MLKKKIEDILNAQVEKEGYSSNLYLAMATWTEANGYGGIAKWFYAQAEEERLHMLKFIHYINEKGGHAIVPVFNAPPKDYSDIHTMFEEVLKHEEYITQSINDIVGMAIDERDFTTQSWIQWFVNEQIEEEAQVREILDKLRLLGKENLYLFDRDIMTLRAANAAADAGE